MSSVRGRRSEWNSNRSQTRSRPGINTATEAWVHDKYHYDSDYRSPSRSRSRSYSPLRSRRYDEPAPERTRGRPKYKIFVRNLSPDVTEDEFRTLFRSVGPVSDAYLIFDERDRRTGRGVVIYDHREDAFVALDRFDGRQAKGQIIYLDLQTEHERDRARSDERPGRGLAERITLNGANQQAGSTYGGSGSVGRENRSRDHGELDGGYKRDGDRYGRGGDGARPRENRDYRSNRDGEGRDRRDGARNWRHNNNGRAGNRGRTNNGNGDRRNRAPAKTKEELDAELDNYLHHGPDTEMKD